MTVIVTVRAIGVRHTTPAHGAVRCPLALASHPSPSSFAPAASLVACRLPCWPRRGVLPLGDGRRCWVLPSFVGSHGDIFTRPPQLGHLKPSLRIVTHVWRGPRARRRRGMGGARGEGKQGGAGRAKVEGGRSGGSGGGEGRYVTFFLVFRKWPAPAKRWPGWWRHGVSAGRTLALLAAALGCRLLRPHLDTLVRVVSEQRQSCCCAPTSSSLWYPSSSGGRAAAAPISPSSWCTSSSDRAAAATDALTSAS
ncbi:hypothetical protein BDZ97DRAFT_1911941 [Flammula alnicola]|nr:hypothetical protein BDZ97DRAFT_1911941 [Flammula alnicola]